MAFGKNTFGGSLNNFGGQSLNRFNDESKDTSLGFNTTDNPFKFAPKDSSFKSRIRFYDRDGLWTRWRRGYEMYTILQSVYGTTPNKRRTIGDYRSYCAFQQYPGFFVPARFFTFPSSSVETGEHYVAMRDANCFNFYDFGLPILAVRYLGNAVTVPYSQTGTTITVSYPKHGFVVNDNVYLVMLSGNGVTTTLPIVSVKPDSFTCTAAAPVNTVGNVSVSVSTTFSDPRWTETRVRVRYLPTPAGSFVGERFADRIVEGDPGVVAAYTQIGSTVTVTCNSVHGLATGDRVNFSVVTGAAVPGLYPVTVVSNTVFTLTVIGSAATTGTSTIYRLIEQYNYKDYVGYTVTFVDEINNELVFQRADSYGVQTVDSTPNLTVPAQRGFAVGRFLTTELRYQCTCQDYTRRESYDLYSSNSRDRFPTTAITSIKPGTLLNKDNTVSDVRENVGVFSDLGYNSSNNFNQLPDYNDQASTCYTALMYYQIRWCKHIYAAFFSLSHSEGNYEFNISAKYQQSNSPDISITAINHGFTVGTKIQIEFTSGAGIDGQYTVSQVIDANNFIIVYPFSQITSGYCTLNNLKEHDYVRTWINEPTDHPVGDQSDVFYKNFTKENTRFRQAAQRSASLKMGNNWLGSTTISDFQNQPQSVADYNPYLFTSLLTDSVTRDATGAISISGLPKNTSQRLIAVLSKVVNLEPTLIQSTKFGFLDQPLINYNTGYQFGLILCGEYLNGEPLEDLASRSTIDCNTYDPQTSQDTLTDCGTYAV